MSDDDRKECSVVSSFSIDDIWILQLLGIVLLSIVTPNFPFDKEPHLADFMHGLNEYHGHQ